LQLRQILPVYIYERSLGVHVVPVQRRGIIDQQSLRLGNNSKAVSRFLYSCNELIVGERVFPTEPNEEWVGSLAWLAGGWGWEGRWGVCVGEVALEERFDDVRDETSTLGN